MNEQLPLSEEQMQVIGNALAQRGAMSECDRCGNPNLSLQNGIINLPMSGQAGGGMVLTGRAAPLVMVTCTNCGGAHFHALTALGVLEEIDVQEEVEP